MDRKINGWMFGSMEGCGGGNGWMDVHGWMTEQMDLCRFIHGWMDLHVLPDVTYSRNLMYGPLCVTRCREDYGVPQSGRTDLWRAGQTSGQAIIGLKEPGGADLIEAQ